MRERFQILSDPRFRLVYNETRRFAEGSPPTKIRLNRLDFNLIDGLKKKSRVYPGMLLATHPSAQKGDLHAPMYGVVSDISHRSIFIDAVEREADDPILEPIDIMSSDKTGDELAMDLKRLGVNMKSLRRQVKTLIINGLNPDPGVTWAEPMLQTHVISFQMGMELHKRISRADKIILAVPKGVHVTDTDIEVVHVDPKYPNSVSQLLIREVTGKENPKDVATVGLHNIWSLGRVAATGFPLMDTVLTIGSATKWGNYIVKNGITVGQLLDCAGIVTQDGDTVLRNGPLRGESLDGLDRSTTKGTTGLFVVEAGTVPPMEGHSPCVNCGACVQVCPARITPSVISKYAEFARHDKCREEQSTLCVECGLCGYVCIARRPVLQYIRLANTKIREEDDKLEPIIPFSMGEDGPFFMDKVE